LLKILFSVALFLVGQMAVAAEQPSAGSQIQQIPALPAPQTALPEIGIEQDTKPDLPAVDQMKIAVARLQVQGAQLYAEADLIAITGFVPGAELTLTDLRVLASRITDHYHQHGYFLAQAFLPPQEVVDGLVTITVLEGQYGEVSLNNHSKLSDVLANDLFDGLKSGDVIASAPLENRLLLLSDLAGININSTLVPGASIGSADLIVDITPGQRLSGSLDADNAGNPYTGDNRLGASLNFNNPAGRGDAASLRLLTTGAGLNYGRIAYQTQIGKTQAGVAFTSMRYELGRDFAALLASGTVRISSIFGSYPLIRSRFNNLRGQLAYDTKSFSDREDITSTIRDKRADVWMASLVGNRRNISGVLGYAFTWTNGDIELQSPAELAIDSGTARTNGRYQKLGINLSWQQNLTATTSLYAALNGQFAGKNLDASEKMALGGVNAVRAYPEGETYGDEGYVLNLEVRRLLPAFSAHQPGQLQLIGFADSGTMTLNKDPWGAGSNRRTLSGLGLGLNWFKNNDFMVKAYVAHKLGNAVATSSADADSRFWLQGIKYF